MRECDTMATTHEYEDAYMIMHPLRRKIIEELTESPSYTAKIARDLGMKGKERLLGFHLTILAMHGFIEGEFQLANPATSTPKAVKYYTLTDKTTTTLKELSAKLSR